MTDTESHKKCQDELLIRLQSGLFNTADPLALIDAKEFYPIGSVKTIFGKICQILANLG